MPAGIGDAYATIEEYRSAISKTDAGDDGDVGPDLIAVSRWLDRKLARFFTKDVADVARTYYPKVSPAGPRPLDWAESENPWLWGGYVRFLLIDDLSAPPTSVIIDDKGTGLFTDSPVVAPTNYSCWPENADKGPEPRPFTALFAPSWSTTGGFPSGKRIQIVGKWGWPSIPEPIKRVTIQLTGVWRLESPRATSRVNELDQVVSTSKLANGMLAEVMSQYMRADRLI